MSIIATIVGGAIIGAVARMVKPGADPMGWIMTILFGIAGAFIGSYIAHGGLWGWLVAVVITVALLFGWDAIKRRGD